MSADAHFKDFVERQHRPASVDIALDWNKERDDWLVYLQRLYDGIAGYLDEYIKSGTIKLLESTIELNEENIGVYKAKRLAVVIGLQKIVLTPVGTLLIGSKGRVDVEGSAGSSRLVLINNNITNSRQNFRFTAAGRKPETPPAEIEWDWRIVSRPPAMRFIELNKQTFFEMLMEVSNG